MEVTQASPTTVTMINHDDAIEPPAPSGITYEELLVTPDMARQWLTTNRRLQRPVTKGNLDFLSRQMSAGLYQPNGETIKFNERGELIDGQHRLRAIAKSGVMLRLAIARNVPDASFPTIDTGRVRNGADSIGMAGYPHDKEASRAVRLLARYEHGWTRKQLKLSNREVVDIYEQHHGLARSVETGIRAGKQRILGAGTAAFLHFIFAEKDLVLADAFFEAFISGTGLHEGMPVYVLREWLTHESQSEDDIIARAIKAWNVERRGGKVKRLTWSRKREEFPSAE